MVGVKLKASFTATRKLNCDELQNKVKSIVAAWKGGKFMPLTQRPFSINCYCLSKIWFRCASLPLRACDFSTITSSLKSWIYADQLEKPNELALYRPRKHGGLALINVQFKSLSLLIKTFLEMAVVPKQAGAELGQAQP